ncbi:hypothetical protein TI39_contig4368g00001 [Zymoseptoria brevis]|uniref:Condensation domain-containing protein n=1 Tax=Zymoseptoria brevis TaxID=1047168 RepID=A0A0F4G850_9PEZI|nr:hypothetical protein TI39_contig4368g00001 [Zymoseptoria brevis]
MAAAITNNPEAAAAINITDTRLDRQPSISHLSSIPEPYQEKVESIAPATGFQAVMLSEKADGSYRLSGPPDEFTLEFSPALSVRRLEQALASVIEHHTPLRTLLIYEDSTIYQVVLKADEVSNVTDWRHTTMLPSFRLEQQGEMCTALHLKIHHAFYDAISFKLMLSDLNAAYQREPLSDGPRFDDWANYLGSLDNTRTEKFWLDYLSGSASMTRLTIPSTEPSTGDNSTARRLSSFSIPSENLARYPGTSATILKAAWAMVLSRASHNAEDVLFAEITANRNLNIIGIEEARGPCLNLLPVRAHVQNASTMMTLASELQTQAEAALPHHHIDCRTWLRETGPSLGSVLLFQDYGHRKIIGQLGGSDVQFKSESHVLQKADVWIVAYRDETQMVVDVDCSASMSEQTAEWLTASLKRLLG